MRNLSFDIRANGVGAESISTLTKNVDDLNTSLTEQKRKLTSIKQLERDSKGLQKSEFNLEKHKLDLDDVAISRRKLTSAIKKAGKPTAEQASKIKKLDLRYKRLTAKVITETHEIDRLGKSLRRSGVDTSKLSKEQKRLKDSAFSATKAIGKESKELKHQSKILKERSSIPSGSERKGSMVGGVASAIAGTGALTLAAVAGKKTLTSSIRNEAEFGDVIKNLPALQDSGSLKKTGKESDADKKSRLARDDLENFAISQKYTSSTDMNTILAKGAASGITDIDELKKFALQSSKVAAAFDGIGAEEAGDQISTLKNSLKLDQNEAYELAGTTNLIGNRMKANPADIVRVLARQGANAKLAGFSADNSAAIAGTLLAGGETEETAATGLQQIASSLTVGKGATGAQKQAFEQMGFDPVQLASSMQRDADGTLLEVMDSLKQNVSKDDLPAVLKTLFGDGSKSVAKLMGNTELFKDALKLSESSGAQKTKSIDTEYEEKVSKTKFKLIETQNALEKLSIGIGKGLMPALNYVLTPLNSVISSLATFANEFPKISATIATTLGIVGTAAAAYGTYKLSKRILGGNRGAGGDTADTGRFGSNKASQRTVIECCCSDDGAGRRGKKGKKGRKQNKRSRLSKRIEPQRRSRLPRFGGRGVKAVAGLSTIGVATMAYGDKIADMVGSGTDALQGLKLDKIAKVVKPIGLAMNAYNVGEAAIKGDIKGVASETGAIAGSIIGGALGAIGGPMGIAVGATLGGFAGEYLGGQLVQLFDEKKLFTDKIDKPDVAAQKVIEKTNATKALNQNNSNTLNVTISPIPNMEQSDIQQAVTKAWEELNKKVNPDMQTQERFSLLVD